MGGFAPLCPEKYHHSAALDLQEASTVKPQSALLIRVVGGGPEPVGLGL